MLTESALFNLEVPQFGGPRDAKQKRNVISHCLNFVDAELPKSLLHAERIGAERPE